MTKAKLVFDPYSDDFFNGPYETYRRMREEAPVYYNEQYDFYAVSRFEDCERGLVDAKRYISVRGGVLELIKANIEMPPGNLIFEDPPAHDVHRKLLSRVFTPRRISALEPTAAPAATSSATMAASSRLGCLTSASRRSVRLIRASGSPPRLDCQSMLLHPGSRLGRGQ